MSVCEGRERGKRGDDATSKRQHQHPDLSLLGTFPLTLLCIMFLRLEDTQERFGASIGI